ncbi:MAG: TonB-dependent receptor [Bryobacterales bacterium]|nr:TonB-dependent receptor [Bryobacterales bacterium]
MGIAKLGILLLLSCAVAAAQEPGTIRGKVVLEPSLEAVPNATVLLVQTGRSTTTGADGAFEFTRVAPGSYEILAHLHPLSDDRERVVVETGQAITLELRMHIAPIHEHVTVTASGHEETALEAFQSVTAVESLRLASRSAPSLGEVLENEPGVAKRSSGPGTTRPVVRGFDGDRVLILQDSMPTGTLSYQSGDHGEPMEASAMERIEVVRGPATLLYGGNAIGGVVNAISSHHQIHEHPHEGVRGHMTAFGGSNNALGGGSAGFEYGTGKWLLWGGGGGQRTGDYGTPLGRIENSQTRLEQASVGLGHYGRRFFTTGGYGVQDGRYGVPSPHGNGGGQGGDHLEEGPVDVPFRRQWVRFSGGVNHPAASLDNFRLTLSYSDWRHREEVGEEAHNRFFNKQFAYRGVFTQTASRRFSGSFGFQGLRRDYKSIGDESLTPPVTQDSLAAFAVEQFDLRLFRVQLGGRLEHTGYNPEGLRSRSFTGFSGAAGLQRSLWEGGSAILNYTHSFRAPALEELYAFGPHAGNLTFEIGDPGLQRERAEGLDASIRHHSSRLRADFNVFQYWIGSYVFLAPTGVLHGGLLEAAYRQGNATYRGTEARLDLGLRPDIWLNLGLDTVRAELTRSDLALPRIPPVRGHAALDIHYRGFNFRPGLELANHQDRVFPTETPTAGYGVFSLETSYIVTRKHALHVFGARLFNLNDRLYRNHLSFIKEFAPEIGRGVRFHYTVQFF